MTRVGTGGVAISALSTRSTFDRDFKKLDTAMQDRVLAKIADLQADPRPPGLRFEKLKGYRRPDIYTIHITGNYKLSFEIIGATAVLRRVSCHDEIDRRP